MLNHIPNLPDWAQSILFPINRWLHILCTCLLVGGTLFYEFVIPKSIEDLKEETQLAVLGRVRWSFRKVVVFATVVLVVTGAISTWRHLPMYTGVYREVAPWVVGHIVGGVLAMAVAVLGMIRTRARATPLLFLRVNFVILMIVIFVASTARHLRLAVNNTIFQNNPMIFERYKTATDGK